jgi:hypothetical protein
MVGPESIPIGSKIGAWVFQYLATKVLDETKDRWIKPLLKKRDVEKSFSTAIDNALIVFKQKYPDLYQSLFDECFVEQHAISELAKLLRRTEKPDNDAIALAYRSYYKIEIDHIEEAVEYFINAAKEKIKEESALQELINNQQIEEINEAVLKTIVPSLDCLNKRIDDFLQRSVQPEANNISCATYINAEDEAKIADTLGNKSADLLSWPQLLSTGEWIDRPELDTLLTRIYDNKSSVTVVLGGPGSGKSALMARLGHDLIKRDYFLLAIKADLLPRSVESADSLQQWLHLPDSVYRCLVHLTIGKPVILLIDQLDALCDLIDLHTGRLSILLELANDLSSYPNLHLVLSCRDFEFRHDVRFQRLDADEIQLALPSWEKISEILTSHGFVTGGWPESFREILRTPQYLKVFLEFLSDAKEPVFSSYQSMLEEVWQKKVVSKDGNKQRAELLQSLAAQMAEDEELWAPVARYDAFTDEIIQLEANGILKHSPDKLKIGFSHQTIFDFTRARSFTAERGRFSDYVIERQDALFVRPTIWSTLGYLRGADKSAYHAEFGRLWKAQNLRIHVRFLMTEFLGQLHDPDDQEAVWLLPALEDPRTIRRALWVTQGNQGWFELICSGYLPSLMTADKDTAWLVVPFLSRAWQFARENVLALIEQYWLPSSGKDAHILQVIQELDIWDERACKIAETILSRTEIASSFVCGLASTVSVKTPQLASRLVAAQLWVEFERAKLNVEKNVEKLPELEAKEEPLLRSFARSDLLVKPFSAILENSNWYDLPAIAEVAPHEFIEALFPWFVKLVDVIAFEEHPFVAQYRDDHSVATSERMGIEESHHYPIIAAIKSVIKGLAETEPDWFIDFLRKWQASDLNTVQRMLVLGLLQLAAKRPDVVLSYLLSDRRRMSIGSYRDQHSSTNKLIRTLVPYLAPEQVKLLETHVLNWSQYTHFPKDDEPKVRFDRLKYDRQDRLRLLRAFPKESLTPESQRLILEEERALGCVDDSDYSFEEARFIGSPVSASQMERAKDEDILGLFERLDDNSGWDHPRFYLKGGSIQASREFAQFAKSNPGRAMELIRKFQPEKQERPVADAIRALAEEGKITQDQLFSLVFELEKKGFKAKFYREDAAHALAKSAKEPLGLTDEICELLKGWLSSYEQPESELDNEGQAERKDKKEDTPQSILWNHHRIRFLPSGNLPILQALFLGYLLRRPCMYDRWLDILEEHLERKENSKVWEALAEDLRWLRNADKERSERVIQRVLKEYLMTSTDGAFLIAWVHHWISPEIVHNWLETLKSGTWETGFQAFGELVVLCYAVGKEENREWYLQQIDAVISGIGIEEPKLTQMRVGCAFSAAHLWSEAELSSRVSPILIRLIPEAVKSVASAILHFLNQSNPLPIDKHTRSLMDAIIAHPKILKEGSNYYLAEKLAGLLPSEAERVYQVCIALLEQRGSDIASVSSSFAVSGDELINISLTLQRINTHRAKGLDLFERLLDLGAYGVGETLFELDRRPLNAPPPRQRRRKKR